MNNSKGKEITPILLTVKEMCVYMNIGENTARKLLNEPNCPFLIKVYEKKLVNKKFLDKWIDQNTGI